jgi:hydroxyethylthiazole kinase-like uncharacterized protein yjeF
VIPLLTTAEIRAAEEPVLAATPEGTLMQRAATGLATVCTRLLGAVYGRRVVLLVGTGNNGGDVLFAGAHLARRGARVTAVLLDTGRAHATGLAALRTAGGRVLTTDAAAVIGRADLVLDGMLGIGGRGSLRPEAAGLARLAGASAALTVAVDIPSGIDADTGAVDGAAFPAMHTVTFGAVKPGLVVGEGRGYAGEVHLVDIGLDLPPAPVTALQESDVRALLPRPAPSAHKYTRGVVGVRAGSEQYPGAGVLCVSGASAGLVGMVRYLGGAADLVRARHPEVVVGTGRVQAWVIGSGGGADAEQALQDALADGVPVVVDADGLEHVTGPLGVPALLTPHAGELSRMLDVPREDIEADQLQHARLAAERFGSVVLLKGRHTLVAEPGGRVQVTTVGPAWLATAGAGDVLAGLCGALLAAGLHPFDAGAVGSWLHGAAATAAGGGGPVVATDVAAALPGVCRRLLA